MKLEEAIGRLNRMITVSSIMKLDNLINSDADMEYIKNADAIEIALQEIERLQKENEELISEKTKLLLTDLAEANKLYDEENKRCMMFAIENNDLKEKLNNSISKDKIREKIKMLKKIYELVNVESEADYCLRSKINILEDLLE